MWINLDERQHATVLAALRYWQRAALGSPTQIKCFAEYDIVTNGETVNPLDETEIDTFCEQINMPHRASAYELNRARTYYTMDTDDIQIDDDAATSPTDEDGTWVHAWVWLQKEESEA